MIKNEWVLQAPDAEIDPPSEPPKKGMYRKMPVDPEEDPTGNEPPEESEGNKKVFF